MGLAYDLIAEDIGGTLDWRQIFTNNAAGITFVDPTSGSTPPIATRWDGIEIPAYPEFDVIIRDVYLADGNAIIVGSYRAEFTDNPHSITDFQYAWDGFIAITRSFKWTGGLGSTYEQFVVNRGYLPFTEEISSESIQILPMRMPYEWKPGGTAAEIAADSSVGLYGLDMMRESSDDLDENAEQGNVFDRILACGFGRIDGSTEGALSDQDYIAAAYSIPVQWNSYILQTEAYRAAGTPSINRTYFLGGQFPQDGQVCSGWTWKAGTANHTDNTPAGSRFQEIPLDQWLSDNTRLIPSTISGGAPAETLIAQGYYPRRFLNVACAVVIDGWPADPFGPFVLVGDCAKDDGGGAVDYYSPLAVGCYTGGGVVNGVPGQFTNLVMSGRTEENTQLEDTGTAYDLQGAWFSDVVFANEAVGPGLNNISIPTLILCENTDHGGANRQASIYIVGGLDDAESGRTCWFDQAPYSPGSPPSSGATSVFPYAVPGGAWETATGLTLPDRWTNIAAQARTFTESEENISKSALSIASPALSVDPPVNNPVDENGVPVGVVGNFPKVGVGNDVNLNQGTVASNVAICLLGYTGSVGSRVSSVLAFDAGTVSCQVQDPRDPAPYDLDLTGYFIQVGSLLESEIQVSDVDAYPASASWDNDRDQWLFSFGRPTVGKFALVSASSDFAEFIDQSDNITVPVAPSAIGNLAPAGYGFGDSAVFRNRLQTNELDGIAIGDDETDTDGPGVSLSVIVDSATSPQGVHSNFVVVKGTTGRVARVWIDYVLYDGVDALVAEKVSELGLQVTPENVEWFKARILRSADVDELDVKTEEIEKWMEAQRKEYTDMMRSKERSGRLRKRKRQISAYTEGVEGALGEANKSSVDTRALDPEDLEDLLRDVGMPDDEPGDRERS
jgi:hypothetical protein